MGGLVCTGTNFHNGGIGLLVDNALSASPNREFDQGVACSFDTTDTYGVLVNDTLVTGGTIDLAGWQASNRAGPGIYIESWPSGDVEIRGDKVYNNCGDGIEVQDTTSASSSAVRCDQ